MSNIALKYNPELDKYKDIILFPSKHQSAIETLVNVTLPNETPLSPIQKINVLLAEIEQTNRSIQYFEGIADRAKIKECQNMKENFALLIQKIMQEQFKVTIFKKKKAA